MPSHVVQNASSGILSRSVHPAKLVLRGMLMSSSAVSDI